MDGLSTLHSCDLGQRASFVHRHVFGLVTLDLVLRFLLGAVSNMSLVLEILRMSLRDYTGHQTRF